MAELTCMVPIPTTLQEIDEAVRKFQVSDLDGSDLYCQWQAIRDASLEQLAIETDKNPVAGGDSY
ncbi:hypothetical protein C7B65_24430 [Phormidesmis priestleyi ULC007]|uniref:Uncharacterized protein n=1 Tax=Phormidesmis priestleyi ULC007 TaxID=1920490 RepID=A0A2T1D4N2_9CYAN|nr:hypothetical protein [Phormidesmis priestleyi]PSB15439.1 hypothetical protein C7B65_24430 [Phormidesmis priestleyi ULC007]PZO46197.1 MAG: hypothetical protein DCF14_23445 [Phormidesmis priestleyi]